MKASSLFLSISIVFLGCSGAEQGSGVGNGVARTIVEVAGLASGTNRADLSITGMSCEVMCGTAIRKALAEVPGVQSAEIAFEEGSDLNHAIVTFDPEVANDKDMVSAVTELFDGVYQVKEVTIEQPKEGKSVNSSGAGVGTQGLDTELPSIQMPNLMDALSRILRI